MKSVVLLLAAVASVQLGTAADQAAMPPADRGPLHAAFDAHLGLKRSSPFAKLEWSFLGPTNVSGVAVDVAVADRSGRRRIYVTFGNGGLWKTDDVGRTWQEAFTPGPASQMGAVAVAPSNPDVVWVGTGAGLYKSVDAARSWQFVGLADARTFEHIVIHPTDANVVYIAAVGTFLTENTTRGVFKTTDGGKTWTRILYRNPRTDAMDLVIDRRDPQTLYATTWQRTYANHQAGLIPGQDPDANQTSIWKSTDGGATWVESTAGLPAPRFRGAIRIDSSPSNPSVLYALLYSYEILTPAAPGELGRDGNPSAGRFKGSEVYRTADGGSSWRKVSRTDDHMAALAPWDGLGQIRVDPKDENTIYALSVTLEVSHDAGNEFRRVVGPHVDHHDLWIDPSHPDVFYDCTDGGIYFFEDGGAFWRTTPVPTAQVWTLALDMATPFQAYGSIQDYNTPFRRLIDVRTARDGLHAEPFDLAAGADEMSSHVVDPANPGLVYASIRLANTSGRPGLRRFDLSDPARGPVHIAPPVGAAEAGRRSFGLLPFILSPHDSKTIYVGYQDLFRSRDRGDHWEQISSDLTGNDAAHRMGPPYSFQAITAMAESPKRPGLVYVGTDDGFLHVTLDDGRSWTALTNNLPPNGRGAGVVNIVASAFAEGTVYVTRQAGRPFRDEDPAPYISRSTDYGRTFASLTANIPTGPVRVIREDPTDPGILYVGTKVGAYVSTNGGERWEVLGGNLPTVAVSDIRIQPRDHVIVIATFGRGLWAMDALRVRAIARTADARRRPAARVP
jgi:photosystem II stability/assembly factor-like uncharacterized protein